MAELKKMTLSNGSKFNFKITFIVPENNVYTQIVITDTLPAGLTYVGTGEEVVKFTSTVTTTPADPTNVDFTNPPNLTITFTDVANLQPDFNNTIDVIIPVSVNDIDALMNAQAAAIEAGDVFQNVAIITPSTAQGASAPLETNQPLEISECIMYGFGSSYEIGKIEGSKAHLLFAHPTIYSNYSNDLVYTTVIGLNEALNYDGNSSSLNIYDVNKNVIGTIESDNITYTNTTTPKTITLTYPHQAKFSEKTIYIDVPVVLNRDLTEADNPLRNSSVTSLSNTTLTDPLICSSTEYYIDLIPTDMIPEITGADKSVSLTLG